jgi:hypothetical protein
LCWSGSWWNVWKPCSSIPVKLTPDPSFGTNLRKTIADFNEFASTGEDEEFQQGDTNYDREWTTVPPSIPNVERPSKDSKNYTMYPLRESALIMPIF